MQKRRRKENPKSGGGKTGMKIDDPIKDEERLSLVGKKYDPELAKKLNYGFGVNSKGIIVEVITKSEHEKRLRKCSEVNGWTD